MFPNWNIGPGLVCVKFGLVDSPTHCDVTPSIILGFSSVVGLKLPDGVIHFQLLNTDIQYCSPSN